MNRIDQMTLVSAEPVQLPDQERVPMTQRLQTGRQVWPVVLLDGCLVLVAIPCTDAGGQERVSL